MNFNAYRLSVLQSFQQMLTQCEADGVTDSRFIRQRLHDHIAAEMVKKEADYRKNTPRETRREQQAMRQKKPIVNCAACGAPAMIEPVNVSPATMIGGGIRMAISCLNPECRHTDYSTHSALEIIGGNR